MKLEMTALSNVGLVREINEDSFRILPEKKLAIVCDGMGGHAAGEVASRLAVDTVAEVMQMAPEKAEIPESLRPNEQFASPGRALIHAIRLANRRIFLQSGRDEQSRGMGTTIVAAVIVDDRVIICHVGDSRVYRFRKGNLEQLTTDHSWVNELVSAKQLTEEESKSFASKNVITRALGTRGDVKIDIRQDRINLGDIYLLCSDGLCGFVSDADILKSLSQKAWGLNKIGEELIERANAAGGEDNITVALIKVADYAGKETFEKEFVQQTIEEETGEELRAEDELLQHLFPARETAHTARINTRPLPVPEKTSGRSGGWFFLAAVLVLAICGYLAYSYNLAGLQAQVDDLFHHASQKQIAPSETATVPANRAGQIDQTDQTTEMAYIMLDSFPDALMDFTLCMDMVPMGTVRQFMAEKLGIDPGFHAISLRDLDDSVYAKLDQTFSAGEVRLSPREFGLAQ